MNIIRPDSLVTQQLPLAAISRFSEYLWLLVISSAYTVRSVRVGSHLEGPYMSNDTNYST